MRVNKPCDLDDLGALELDLLQIFRGDDDVLFGLELVALNDVFGRENLAAFLAFFLVTDRTVVLLV